MSDATIDAKIQQLKELDTQILNLAAQRKQLVAELMGVRDTLNELIGPEGEVETIDVLELSVRTTNCLKAEGVYHLMGLCNFSEQDLLRMPNLGKVSFGEIKTALTARGLSLKIK